MELATRTVIQIHDDQGTQRNVINIRASVPSSQVPEEVVIQIINVPSAQPRLPSTELFNNETTLKNLCVPLHKAALRGDWEDAKSIIAQDPRLLTSSISVGGQTVLHLAAGTENVDFVAGLVGLLSAEDLELQDEKGNTALCNAAATAPVEIARIMLEKNQGLASIRGGGDVTPLYMAAMFKRSEMAWYLYDKTEESFDERDRNGIFFSCINTGIYDLALKMLKADRSLATVRDDNDKTALHHLAQTPSAFADSVGSEGWTKIVESCLNIEFRKTQKQTTALDLVRFLWDEALNLGHDDAMALISSPSELLFDATRLGNCEFLKALVSSYPDLVWEHDSKNRTIFHIAVLYRYPNIFNLIHYIGPKKEIIATYEDDEGNNILHLAAMLPPSDRVNTVSGAALQMHKELLWFEEVKAIVIPIYEKSENNKGMNPSKLFTSEHKELLKEGEKWMKDTSHSGLIVSTILITVVFAAAFSLPGGNNNSGVPSDLTYTSFKIFILSDALAFIFSVVAALMFLSIITSRYTEYDFLKSLPLKLMIGLTSLFFSMMATMVAFSSTIAIACHTELKWVPYLIYVFSFIAIALFAVSQFPLWFDTFSSIYRSRTIFQPTRRMTSWLEKSNV